MTTRSTQSVFTPDTIAYILPDQDKFGNVIPDHDRRTLRLNKHFNRKIAFRLEEREQMSPEAREREERVIEILNTVPEQMFQPILDQHNVNLSEEERTERPYRFTRPRTLNALKNFIDRLVICVEINSYSGEYKVIGPVICKYPNAYNIWPECRWGSLRQTRKKKRFINAKRPFQNGILKEQLDKAIGITDDVAQG